MISQKRSAGNYFIESNEIFGARKRVEGEEEKKKKSKKEKKNENPKCS